MALFRLSIGIAIFFLCGPAGAISGKRVALVTGNSACENAGALANPDPDAKAGGAETLRLFIPGGQANLLYGTLARKPIKELERQTAMVSPSEVQPHNVQGGISQKTETALVRQDIYTYLDLYGQFLQYARQLIKNKEVSDAELIKAGIDGMLKDFPIREPSKKLPKDISAYPNNMHLLLDLFGDTLEQIRNKIKEQRKYMSSERDKQLIEAALTETLELIYKKAPGIYEQFVNIINRIERKGFHLRVDQSNRIVTILTK